MTKERVIILLLIITFVVVNKINKFHYKLIAHQSIDEEFEGYQSGIDYLKKHDKLVYNTVYCIDGYDVVDINGTIWMVDNLNTDTFSNGEAIEEIKDDDEWENAKRPAWCHYNNQDSFGLKYGKIYNWYGVKDEKCLCPKGWKVASIEEWEELVNYYGGSFVAPDYLRSKNGWGDNAGFNNSGFNALPTGYRPTKQGSSNSKDSFDGSGGGVWWSGTNAKLIKDKYITNKTAWGMDIGTDFTYKSTNGWFVGQHVRCTKK